MGYGRSLWGLEVSILDPLSNLSGVLLERRAAYIIYLIRHRHEYKRLFLRGVSQDQRFKTNTVILVLIYLSSAKEIELV
jgi:hypothetical protein